MERRKKARRYDASGRRDRAQKSRDSILDVARQGFLQDGYATTTIAAIARDAGVSVETIYKTFGGKPGLVRALFERGLAGSGARPAPERSDAMSARETDPRVILRNWGSLVAEVSPIVSPILLLVRDAAATDPELAALLRETDAVRLERMRHNARLLARRGPLRKGVTIERAAEIMWGFTSPEMYELFVLRRGWTPKALGAHVANAMIGMLL